MAVQTPSDGPLDLAAAGIQWDKGNREKCRKHGISSAAVEALFHRPLAGFPDPVHSGTEERFKAIGRSDDGRGVLVVFTLRKQGDETFIRPVSARYMHRNEVNYYEKETAGTEKRSGS